MQQRSLHLCMNFREGLAENWMGPWGHEERTRDGVTDFPADPTDPSCGRSLRGAL